MQLFKPTLLDDCSLSEEERRTVERLMEAQPLPMNDIEWVDLAPLKVKTKEFTEDAGAVVLVASGGIDLYTPSKQPLFVFDSRVHPPVNLRGLNDPFQLMPAIERPDEYHRDELERLAGFLSGYSNVAVIEGEAGIAGVSFARLASIQTALKKNRMPLQDCGRSCLRRARTCAR